MARNDNIRDITTFLMMNNSNPMHGYSGAEIAEAVPHLKRSTVYRILNDCPQFVRTKNSIHPIKYYFDPMKVERVVKTQNRFEIRPEIRPSEKPVLEWMRALIDTTKPVENETKLYNEIKKLGIAANNAIDFQQNKAPLQPAKWEAAKFSIDQIEQFAAGLYCRMQELKSDERYDSPEWWAIFNPEDK